MSPRNSSYGTVPVASDVERDVTVVVKTFERPDVLRRLVSSIRRFYPRLAIFVVDDSAERLQPVPEGITRYFHLPFNSLGAAGGRNYGLGQAETKYVLVSDDDMVFGRRTNLRRMLRVLETTCFDLVSCKLIDHTWSGVRQGPLRWESTLDIADGALVQRFGASRGTRDGLPVFDAVVQFFMADRERLGPDPWDSRLNLIEHTDFFLTLRERGVLCTRLRNVVAYHFPQRSGRYQEFRRTTAPRADILRAKWGYDHKEKVGRVSRRTDRILHTWPSEAAGISRRTVRAAHNLVRDWRVTERTPT
jgi:glycosyltransferase involved in cell wall biosynthesis